MSSDSESNWSDSDDVNTETNDAQCLFCKDVFNSIEDCFDHSKNFHKVDIKSLIHMLKLDFYSYVKFVNYIRKYGVTPKDVMAFSKETFIDDKYLQPIKEGDMMLQFDIDSFLEGATYLHDPSCSTDDNAERKIAIAEEKAKIAEEFLERTLDDLNNCRTELKSLLLTEAKVTSQNHEVAESCGYFSSYAHHDIHEEMLKDVTRTKAYRNFIMNNPKIFHDSVVLDVGCGTSILSMFAAKAGARKVIGVDYSDVAYQAIDIVRENQLEGVISIVKEKAENIHLESKVDVIISEWMGYFLLFESMLDTVIYCRETFLSDGGRIYPDRCNIKLVALADDQLYSNKINYWENVYGFKMSTLKSSVLNEPFIDIVDPKYMMSDPVKIKDFDLMSVSVSDLDFDVLFQLRITKDGLCSSILGYFDILFGDETIENPVQFSTGPESPATHWKQTIFFIKEPFKCKSGDIVNGRMFCKKNKMDSRALDIALLFYSDNEEVILRQHYVIS